MVEFNPGGAASLNAAVKERYEANADTNVFTDAEKAKLAAIEALATSDMSPAEIVSAINGVLGGTTWQSGGGGGTVDSVNSQTGVVVLDADDISDAATLNKFASAAELSKLGAIEAGATADQTAGEIKTAYEGNADTNAFTDAEQSKLAGIAASATANPTAPASNVAGITGAAQITNIVSISQANYDAIVTKDPTTQYVIVG